MNSYLLIGKSPETQEEKAKLFCQNLGIDPLDITLMRVKDSSEKEAGTKEQSQKKKGIALIREVYKTLHLAPLRGDLKALVILEADGLSIPGQNALLKTIEEPPRNTKIILTTENRHLLLPTIISRCLIISHANVNHSKVIKVSAKTISELIPNSVSDALKQAERISKDKHTALSVLEEDLLATRMLLTDAISQEANTENINMYTSLLSSQIETYSILKSTNANLRLALEHHYLSSYTAGLSFGT